MEALIAFTSLSANLTDKEYKEFMIKACTQIDRRLFERAIFSTFKSDSNTISTLIKVVAKIIKDRDDSPDDDALLDNTLDKMPRELISNVASFLNISDYHYFGRTNKNIYIACYSMVTLQKCIAYKMLNLPKQVRKRYLQKARALEGHVETLINLFIKYSPILEGNGITSLTIQNISHYSGCTLNFLSNKAFDWSKLRKLTLDGFGGPNRCSESLANEISRYLSRVLEVAHANAAQLEYLSISSKLKASSLSIIYNIDNIDVSKKWFSNLKGIKLRNVKNAEMIIKAHSSQLEAICIDKNVSIKDQSFPKLVEVQDTDCSFNLDMFDNVTTIKRARICSISNHDEEEIMSFIKIMMMKQNRLEHLSIECDLYLLHGLMENIRITLFDMNEARKNPFHIELVFKTRESKRNAFSDELQNDIIRFVESMDDALSVDFALSVFVKQMKNDYQCGAKCYEKKIDFLFRNCAAFKEKYFVQCFDCFSREENCSSWKIHVANRRSRMNGFCHRYTFSFDKSVCVQRFQDDWSPESWSP